MIGKANNVQDLYVMSNPVKKEEYNTRVNIVSVDLWRKRLGHPSNKVLTSIKNILGISISQNSHSQHCNVYPLAKQKKITI